VGASAGISEYVGEIFELKGGKKPSVEDAAAYLPKLSTAEYTRILNTKKKIHFCTNDAQLTEDAKRFIEVMAALELPALEVPDATFKIAGYTDRQGTPESNTELALARASNVRTYLEDILAPLEKRSRFEARIVARGPGEIEIGPDDADNPSFRRVQVVLDGKLLLSLEGVPDGLIAK
jgi:outer membrane protein OmpA-like peptidoglycan-associated protein